VTVCLMNAYVNGEHERQLRDILSREMPNIPVSISSEVLPEVREANSLEEISIPALRSLYVFA